MAYIQPNSIVKLLRDCPLDEKQRDTWYFQSVSEQRNYFESLVMVSFTSLSYQRIKRGVIRLQYRAEQLLACNYMMFQNTTYNPTKWFYAFVDEVEYLNDNTCNVYYTIDVIQTWFFEYSELECFVKRMSVPDDTFGNNIEPEPFNLPEYVGNGTAQIDDLQPVVICQSILPQSPAYDYTFFENTICASVVRVMGTNSVGAIEDFIRTSMVNNPDYVFDLHMALVPNGDPSYVSTVNSPSSDPRSDWGYVKKTDRGAFEKIFSVPSVALLTVGTSTLNGWKPRNNKLYTYPYNFLNVCNALGESINLRYEFFTSGYGTMLKCIGNVLAPACVKLYPVHYKHTEGVLNDMYLGEQLGLTGFPSCSWSTDAFSVWWAQNSVPLQLKAVNTAIDLGLTAVTPSTSVYEKVTSSLSTTTTWDNKKVRNENATVTSGTHESPKNYTSAVRSGVNSLFDALTDGYKASLQGQITKGSYQNGSINFAKNWHHFYATRMSIPNVTAYRYDRYFDAFGYAINSVTTPKRYNRKLYTYVQTLNCLINGDLPSSDRSEIEKIYDEGVRFWNYSGGAQIGVYDIDNNQVK